MSIKHTSQINKYAYYVHYLASNYEKQQKLPGKGALTEYAIKKVNARAALLHSGISPAVKQEYANTIGALYGQNTGSTKIIDDSNRFYNILTDILNERFDLATNKATLEKESGKISQTGGSSKSIKNLNKTTQKYLTEAQLKELQNLLFRLQNAKISNKTNKALLDNLKDLMNKVYNETVQALSTIPKEIQSIKKNSREGGKWTQLTGFLGKTTQELQLRYKLKDPDLLPALRKAILDCGLAKGATTIAQGFSGEAISAVAAELLTGMEYKTLSKTVVDGILKKVQVGDQRPKLKYIGVGPEAHWLDFLRDKTIKNGTTIISKRGSQQKVDISTQLPDSHSKTGFKKVNISMKAVNLQYAIHVVSGTPLWYLIQEEQRNTFLRPYLNIMADHTDFLTNSKFSVGDKGKEMSSVARVMALRNDATKAIKIIAAYKAISGDTFGRTAAQLFVIKDTGSKKGKVYVLEISDIVRAILKSLGSFSPVEKFFDIDFSKSLELRNRWEDNLDIRMSEILKNCHENKVNAALRFSEVMGLIQRRGQLITSQ